MSASLQLEPIERLVALQRLRDLKQKKAELVHDFGLMRYVPHPKQDRFHRMGAKLRRGVFAGNRFGKSQMGCAEDCAWLYGERIWYPKDDPARYVGLPRRPVKGLVIAEDWDKVDEIWTSESGDTPGKLWQLLPADFVSSKKRNHSGAIDMVECQNGSVLRFDTVRSFLTNKKGAESSDWDFIHIDEPCPEAMWKAASRGLVDRLGSAWFTLTALSEPWITDMFVPRNKKLKHIQEMETEDFWMLRGAMQDNPHLTEKAIQMYAADLTEDEKQCRLYGIPLTLVGLVYKEFDFDRHVLQKLPLGWSGWSLPPTNWPVYLAIDPHPQTPHAVLALTVSPQEQVFVFDEIFMHCTIDVLCEMMHEKFDKYHKFAILCDPFAWVNDPITGSNMGTEFEKNKIFVDKATKALHQGIMRTKAELSRQGRLYFSPHLEETLWEIQRYSWDTNPDRINKPVDKDDHMMENLYRLLLEEPRWRDVTRTRSTPVEEEEITKPEMDLEDLSFAL